MPEGDQGQQGGQQGGQGQQGQGQGQGGQQGGQQGGAATPWHGQTDPAAVEYITNKGWQSPADVVKSYQGAEKLIGRDPSSLLVVPRSDDEAGLMSVFDKLGRPASADKYEFAKMPEGLKQDEGYVAFARDAFHKIGMLPAQVKKLTGMHNDYVKGVYAKQEKDYQDQVALDRTALQAEWRGGHDNQMALAKSAATMLGLTEEDIGAIERVKGYAGTWKLFADLGKKLGEDKLVTGGQGGDKQFTGTMTPAEAKAKWDEKKLDANFMSALRDKSHPGHEAAQKVQTDLFKVMYPQ